MRLATVKQTLTMMAKLFCFVQICFALITQSQGQILTIQGARGKMGLKNFFHLHKYRLKVPAFASFETAKEMQCTVSCLKSEECFSLNVKKLTANSFLCELLNTSKHLHAENLTRDESFSHYYSPVPNFLYFFPHIFKLARRYSEDFKRFESYCIFR